MPEHSNIRSGVETTALQNAPGATFSRAKYWSAHVGLRREMFMDFGKKVDFFGRMDKAGDHSAIFTDLAEWSSATT